MLASQTIALKGAKKMNDAKKVPKQDGAVELSITPSNRKKANKAIGEALEKFHHHRLSWILPYVATQTKLGHFPRFVLTVLLERLDHQRSRNDLSFQEIAEIEAFKASQKQP